jgi:uncharacterized membrane protein
MGKNSLPPTLLLLSRDSRMRSLAKTVVYRVVAIGLLAVVGYLYTGNAGEATTVSILFNAAGALAYYVIERLWESVEWGRAGMERGADYAPASPSALTLSANSGTDRPDSIEDIEGA